ncbi:hypothetical protein GNQ12_06550 [Pseudomonas aeruginosa]|uniref:hypothetical protein n=1 Tax=Pseudomonas aeruginosa TaxID=287 RepID=UPI0012DA1480|nr:hypothetical protein [Pseudomonas aeruginosa]MUJ05117.1 hypothetical protein [Pseudomonas aeruginosa]
MTESKICTCPSGDGSLRWPCPAHPAEQAGGDERASKPGLFCRDCGSRLMVRGVCSIYCPNCVKAQARAALAQPSPAPELERPEVVGYLATAEHPKHGQPHKAFNYFKDQHDAQVAHWRERGCTVTEDRLMTVSQHERIVGALRADRDSWAEQAEQRLADWDEMRKERDAALAGVEELERQEPVALANRGLHAFWVKWTEAAAGLYGPGIKLYAAPVAQAQHSVPGDIMRDAQRYRWLRDQQFYFSFSTENSDAGISSCTAGMSSRFKNLSWVDAAIDSAIAAAPGKEVGHE